LEPTCRLDPWDEGIIPSAPLEAGPSRTFSATRGLQNRVPDLVNQCYFEFYDDPQKRLGAALAHIGATDPSLASLLSAWPTLSKRARTILATLAMTASNANE